MTKHYVVLEYEQVVDGNPDNIPWAEVLAGGVKVTNFKNITKAALEEYALAVAVDDCTADHEDLTTTEVVDRLIDAGKKPVPDEIVAWEPFENMDSAELLEEIEGRASCLRFQIEYFLQIEQGELE